MVLIRRSGVDAEVRKEREFRQSERRREDIARGITKDNGACRGDYKLCRDVDKTLSDYRRFKDPKDRKKIADEYYGKQREVRKYG